MNTRLSVVIDGVADPVAADGVGEETGLLTVGVDEASGLEPPPPPPLLGELAVPVSVSALAAVAPLG